MPVPGKVTLDEMKLLLERAHKGEIIPLYVFMKEDTIPYEYWMRRLDRNSRLERNRLDYASLKEGYTRSTGGGLNGFIFFTNFWYAVAYTLKRSQRTPVPVNLD